MLDFVRSHVEGTDVISCLVKVLQDFPSNSLLVSRSCKALNNFCYHEGKLQMRKIRLIKIDKNKAQFLSCGGYPLLKEVFANPNCTESAKEYAALLLRTVAKTGSEHQTPLISHNR